MKSTKSTLLAILFAIILPSSFALAGGSFFDSYAQMYTVGGSGSTTAQTTFSNQTPYLYIEFYPTPPDGGIQAQLTLTAWQNSNSTNIYSAVSNVTNNQIWLSLANWSNIGSAGQWSITALSGVNGTPFTGTTGFKVNAAPEPTGILLFIFGAFILGFSMLRRKKAVIA